MASSWSIAVVGWLVIPIIHFVLNKLLSYLRSDTSEKLEDLEINTIPNLEQTLTNVTEKRMLIETTDGGKGSESELATLHKKAEKLRSALYEAEDILDLVGYHRMEKKAMGDGNSRGTCRLLVLAISKGSSWFKRWIQVPQEKVQQSLSRKFEDLRAKVLQRTQGSTARDALSASSIVVQVGVDIEQGSAAQPPTPNASLNLHVTSRCCRSILSWPTIVISALRPYWDSSYQAVAKMIIIFYQILLFVIPVLRGLISLPGLCLNWTYEAIGIQSFQDQVKPPQKPGNLVVKVKPSTPVTPGQSGSPVGGEARTPPDQCAVVAGGRQPEAIYPRHQAASVTPATRANSMPPRQ